MRSDREKGRFFGEENTIGRGCENGRGRGGGRGQRKGCGSGAGQGVGTNRGGSRSRIGPGRDSNRGDRGNRREPSEQNRHGKVVLVDEVKCTADEKLKDAFDDRVSFGYAGAVFTFA